MASEELKSGSSILGGFGLALLGSTCCALPVVLIALGLGGAVASTVSAFPWIGTLSEYKAVTFGLTAAVLAYGFWRLRAARSCLREESGVLKWQRRLLVAAAIIFALSLFAAYALLPLVLWFDTGRTP